jgi:hypothetical protein
MVFSSRRLHTRAVEREQVYGHGDLGRQMFGDENERCQEMGQGVGRGGAWSEIEIPKFLKGERVGVSEKKIANGKIEKVLTANVLTKGVTHI